MTFQELYQGVQDIVDDTDSDILIKIKRWLNEAQRDLAYRISDSALSGLTATASGTTTVNLQEYDLPTDLMRLSSVLLDNKKCTINGPEQLGQMLDSYDYQANSKGPHCYIWANKLVFQPTMDSALDYDIYYLKKPTELVTDSQEPQLPSEVEHLMIDYTAARYFETQQDSQANYHKQLYISGVNDANDRYNGIYGTRFAKGIGIESEV